MESFGGRLRDELPAVETFNTLLEARVLVEDWRIEYNTLRPHSALGYLTPTDYTKKPETTQTNPRTLIASGPTTWALLTNDQRPSLSGDLLRSVPNRSGRTQCRRDRRPTGVGRRSCGQP